MASRPMSPMNADGPGYNEIAERAYEIFEQRGGNDGRDLDDWLEAEMQLTRERQTTRA
jgi:hypothetical protein